MNVRPANLQVEDAVVGGNQDREEQPPQPATILQQIIGLKDAKGVLLERFSSSYLKLNVFEEAANECILGTVLKQYGISFQRCFSRSGQVL